MKTTLNKPWICGFSEPLNDYDLVNRARISMTMKMYQNDTIVPALVRTVDRLEAELKQRRQ